MLFHPHPTIASFIDLTGAMFSRLTVTGYAGKVNNMARWHCLCECGQTVTVYAKFLKSKHTQSCGCLRREATALRRRIHGHAGNESLTPEYRAWAAARSRCYSPAAEGYKNYGGRGITVCDRWATSFTAFLDDMGRRPSPRHSIDRIDVNGNYEPGNCRWATRLEQARNRRVNVVLHFKGKTMCVADWAKTLGVSGKTIHARLRSGWPVERALTFY